MVSLLWLRMFILEEKNYGKQGDITHPQIPPYSERYKVDGG